MKQSFIVVFLLHFSLSLFGQKPLEILGIAKEKKSLEYYLEQHDLWSKVILKEPKNGFAWRQKYLAKRAYLQKKEYQKWVNDNNYIYDKLDPIIEKSHREIGSSYEYFLMKSMNSHGTKSLEFAKKAYHIDPDRKETLGWLLVSAVIKFHHTEADEYGAKMLKANIYSNANLIWNHNSLISMDKNAIFIGNGDLDITPKWVLQHGENLRKDILVISKWTMVNDEDYRRKIFNVIGINPFAKTLSDFDTPSEYADYITIELLKNKKRKAYVSCGADVRLFEKYGIEEKMYVIGTLLVYSENSFNNKRVTVKNVSNYKLDHLLRNYQQHQEDEMINTTMHLTYLPSLIKVIKYYEEKNRLEEVEYYKQIVKSIAAKSEKESEILGWNKYN